MKRYKFGSDGLVWWLLVWPTLRLIFDSTYLRVSLGTVGREPCFLTSGPYKAGD